MLTLLALAMVPIVAIGTSVYLLDRYDREPIGQLILAFVYGCLTVLPVLFIGSFLNLLEPQNDPWAAGYRAFITASFNEEIFKMAALILVTFRNRHFNERLDGIVYGVFVALGFAAIENIMYVFSYGKITALTRAITAVPAHAMFGVFMGYHLARFRFKDGNLWWHGFALLALPVFWHGMYDFILMSSDWAKENLLVSGAFVMTTFVVFLIYAHRLGLKRFSRLLIRSKKRWTGK